MNLISWLFEKNICKIVILIVYGLVLILGTLSIFFVLYIKKRKSKIINDKANFSSNRSAQSEFGLKKSYYHDMSCKKVAEELNMPEEAIVRFKELLYDNKTPIDQWDESLNQLAERCKKLHSTLSNSNLDNSEVYSLQIEASDKIYEGDFEEAELLLDDAVKMDDLKSQSESENHLIRKRSAAKNQANISYSLLTRSDFNSAITSYHEALKYAQDGQDKIKIANFEWSLARVYADNRQHNKSITFYEKALNHYLVLVGDEPADIPIPQSNLWIAWPDEPNVNKSIGFYENVLAADRYIYGDEHPNVATGYYHLGNLWLNKGNYDNAIEYFTKALTVYKKIFGDAHPGIAKILKNIGVILNIKGDYIKASEIFEMALCSLSNIINAYKKNI